MNYLKARRTPPIPPTGRSRDYSRIAYAFNRVQPPVAMPEMADAVKHWSHFNKTLLNTDSFYLKYGNTPEHRLSIINSLLNS